jgi:hypothetical protein
MCKKFQRLLEKPPIFSPSFPAYDISHFFATEELNRLYIKTHIILDYSGKKHTSIYNRRREVDNN